MKPEALLKLYKAMRLDAYHEPPVLDRKHELEASTEKTRFGQPVARGWTRDFDTNVIYSSFTPTSGKDLAFYRTELDALVATRNAVAIEAATKLAKLDRQITKLFIDGMVVGTAFPALAEQATRVASRKVGKSAALAAPFEGNPPAEQNFYATAFEEMRAAGLTPTGRTPKEPEPQEPPKPEARPTGFSERMKAAREAKKQKGHD